MDLNLFAARDNFQVTARVLHINSEYQFLTQDSTFVFYALENNCELNGVNRKQGDAVIAEKEAVVNCQSNDVKLFVGNLLAK